MDLDDVALEEQGVLLKTLNLPDANGGGAVETFAADQSAGPAASSSSMMPGDLAQPSVEAKDEKKKTAKMHRKGTRKPKSKEAFAEDPFLPISDDFWNEVRSFYGLSSDFPRECLLTRSSEANSKRIYFLSKRVRDIMLFGNYKFRLVHAGLRAFERNSSNKQADNLESTWRVSQEGVSVITPYITRQRIEAPVSDLLKLLHESSVRLDDFSPEFSAALSDIKQGGFVIESQRGFLNRPLLVSAWKARASVNLLVDANEKRSYLALLESPPPSTISLTRSS